MGRPSIKLMQVIICLANRHVFFHSLNFDLFAVDLHDLSCIPNDYMWHTLYKLFFSKFCFIYCHSLQFGHVMIETQLPWIFEIALCGGKCILLMDTTSNPHATSQLGI